MADPGPRRVSKAFMLGLSDKPFKTPPGPPSNFKQMVRAHLAIAGTV